MLLDALFNDLDGPGGDLIAESAHALAREWRPTRDAYIPPNHAWRVVRTPDGDVAYHALTVTYDGRRVVAFRATFAGPPGAMLGAFDALFRLAASYRCPPYILHYHAEPGTPLVSRSSA